MPSGSLGMKWTVEERKDSTYSSETSLKVPHTPRLAEATSVCSPNEVNKDHRPPFADPPSQKKQSDMAQAQPPGISLGYISSNNSARHHIEIPIPLKSIMRAPGTPERKIDNPLSSTFREKQLLEKNEQGTEKEQAKDLKIKTRVRVAKFVLRGVNFSCSLIVLAMLSMTFAIFNATKHLAPRDNFPPWAQGQKTWPQITVLVISCISLAFCLLIFWSYWRGGHKKAEKVAVYSTLFAVGFFIFSIVMWAIAAAILHQSKNSGQGKDMWGWSCVDNDRRQLFREDVDYVRVCKMQQRLRKSMDVRDRARSDLYLAQLRSQPAPNTPGFDPISPSYPTHVKFAYSNGSNSEEGFAGAQSVKVKSNSALNTESLALQSATPKVAQNSFERPLSPPVERRVEHVSAAPGEQTYDAVPIPGAYASPLSSAGLAHPQHQWFRNGGQAITSERRIESSSGSPRDWK